MTFSLNIKFRSLARPKKGLLWRLWTATWWPSCAPLLLFGLLCTIAVCALPARPRSTHLAISGAHLIAAVWGALACCIALQKTAFDDASTRRSWRLCAIALGCSAVAVLAQLSFNLLRFQTPHFPSPADIFWVAQPPLLTLALLPLAWRNLKQPDAVHERARIFMDAAIVVMAVLVLLWTALIEPRFTYNNSSTSLSWMLWFYYPLADVVFLFSALLLFFAARGRLYLTRAAGLLLLGSVSLVSANAIYFYRVLHHRSAPTGFNTGTPLDIGWIWACLLIGCGAVAYSTVSDSEACAAQAALEPDADDDDARIERSWQQFFVIWLPYCAALCVALILIFYEYRSGSIESARRLLPALSLLLVIVARQMLTLADNARLSERLSSANLSLARVNTDLERNVQDRTQHLATLHGITSTLNTSLDRRTVLRVALERTMSAVGADRGGIWLRGTEEEDTDNKGAQVRFDAKRSMWKLAHAHGFGKSDPLQIMLRDLAVAAAEDHQTPAALLGSTQLPHNTDFVPSPENVALVPIRWGGALLGTLGLLRHRGVFSDDDRALAESVALETGTALQNARLYQEARHRADRDSVTGLLNHRAMQERLNASLGLARRHKVELSVVMMDLNNFKFFNDTYGHPVGDEVLRTVARHLQELCRENDIVGRYGGDEFIVLLPDTGGEGTREFCGRVASRLNEHHFQADSGSRIPIEMSFGWAVYPRDADSPLELLSLADSNLYEYKHSGGFKNASRAEAAEQSRIEIRKLKNRAAGGSFGVLDALVTAIDNKDRYTRRHSEEVTHYSLLVAKELGYSEEAMRAVRIAGLLHDVGKIAVPDEILRHPGQLDAEEWDIMKQHPVFGALIVKDLPHLDEVLSGVRHHHERWDGKGYPDALKENDIPMMGRLLAVGDCFSAMTTNRPYRKAFAPEDALREIERSIGVQFDPIIAETFITVMRRELSGTSNLQDAVPTISPEEMRAEISKDVLVATL